MIKITINGIHVDVRPGATILEAARKSGISIPTLCFLKNQSAIGSCRLCSVEIEGSHDLVSACNTHVEPGMIIYTHTERVTAWRRMILELIIADIDLSLLEETSQLKKLCEELGVEKSPFATERTQEAILDSNPFLQYNPALCIRCQRCIGSCNNAARNHTLQAGKRGTKTTIVAPFGKSWNTAHCESCGNCAQACPTGAIRAKRHEPFPENSTSKVLTTCPHCGVGCQLYLSVHEGKVIEAEGAFGASNQGRLCVKGRFASYDFVDSQDRLRMPLVKNQETGAFEETSWDEALDVVATRFSDIKREYGGEALAAFACSRSTNEDVYLFQKMGRVAFETNNIDNCARV